jgi:uncharacterized protein (TIGR03435 family)
VITISRFAEVLSRQVDLPVMDNTGLKGTFNLKLVGSVDRENEWWAFRFCGPAGTARITPRIAQDAD